MCIRDRIVVNKEEIEELLRELRLKTPDEIKRYQKIINNKDAILEDAQTDVYKRQEPEWAWSLTDQAHKLGIPVFMKEDLVPIIGLSLIHI